jgi:metal-sulfur cluster biosynthetic enzyme
LRQSATGVDLPIMSDVLPTDALPDEIVAPGGTATSATAATAAPAGDAPAAITVDQAKVALRRVKDPDLNLNIVDLGLVYDVRVDGSVVTVDMSLTSPGCPSGPQIMGDVETEIRATPGVTDVTVNLVWTPFWSPERIEPRVRAYLGF